MMMSLVFEHVVLACKPPSTPGAWAQEACTPDDILMCLDMTI